MDTNTTAATSHRRTPPRSFRTPVRGHAFASRPAAAPDPYPGQPALLVREPGNPADPLAVAVWVEDGTVPWRIGYLDRGVSARVAPRLDRGARFDARFDGWSVEPDGRWRRPVLLLRAASAVDGPQGAGPEVAGPQAAGPEAVGSQVAGPAVAERDAVGAEERGATRSAAGPSTSDPADAVDAVDAVEPAAVTSRGRSRAPSEQELELPANWGRPPGVVRRRLPRRT